MDKLITVFGPGLISILFLLIGLNYLGADFSHGITGDSLNGTVFYDQVQEVARCIEASTDSCR